MNARHISLKSLNNGKRDMTQISRAYGYGKQSVWMGLANVCPFTAAEEVTSWAQGRRDAKAELRLDADAEWDGENE